MKTLLVLRAVVSLSFLAGCLTAADQKPVPDALKDLDPKEIKLGEDEPGCQDSALLARFAGCNIIQCGKKEADSLDLQVGATAEGAAQTETADGASEKIYYLCPGKLLPASIVKQAEAALVKTGGYKMVYHRQGQRRLPDPDGLEGRPVDSGLDLHLPDVLGVHPDGDQDRGGTAGDRRRHGGRIEDHRQIPAHRHHLQGRDQRVERRLRQDARRTRAGR